MIKLYSNSMRSLDNWMKSLKLTLLQTAVRSINDLRIVETLDEFQSTTHGYGSSTSLSYQTYNDLLINACARYDKSKKANIGKRRNVYNSTAEPALTIPKMPLTLFKSYLVRVEISLLMSFIRSMPFPLGIHLLGLVVHQNLPSAPNLYHQDHKSPSKGMMDPSIYHHRSISCWVRMQ